MASPAFDCDECEDTFPSLFRLLEHRNAHTGQKPFMCLCGKSFESTVEYAGHVKEEHLGDGEEKGDGCTCVGCFKGFASHDDFVRHFVGSGKHDCRICGLPFESVRKLVLHKRKTHSHACHACKRRFPTAEKLSGHACLVASMPEGFKCSCSAVFDRLEDFRKHVPSAPYTCCKCSMEFNTFTNLVRHIRTHTKQKPYVCRECHREFSQSAHLRNHSSLHLAVAAIKCDLCDFACKTANGLHKHVKKHERGLIDREKYVDGRVRSSGSETCPVCQRVFAFKRNMAMHMKVHGGESCLCTECGKVFGTRGKLASHFKACHREPSICGTCGKTFASAFLLNAHEKIHVPDKRFSCEICSKAFAIKKYLDQHMKTHSSKKQFSCNKCGKLYKVAVSLKYHSNVCTGTNIQM